MSRRVKIEGLRELDQALIALGKVTAKNAARRTLRKAAEPIRAAAVQAAPVDTGDLIKSVAVSTRNPKRNKKQSPIEVHVGPGRHPQAITQEFGTRDHSPQPYMRPAWAAEKGTALRLIKQTLTAEIMGAAKRQARKAARGAR